MSLATHTHHALDPVHAVTDEAEARDAADRVLDAVHPHGGEARHELHQERRPVGLRQYVQQQYSRLSRQYKKHGPHDAAMGMSSAT